MQYRVCLKANDKTKVNEALKEQYPTARVDPKTQCFFDIEDWKEAPQVGDSVEFDFAIFCKEDSATVSAFGEVKKIVKRYIEPEADVPTKCIISCEVTIFSLRSPDEVFWHYRGEDAIKSLNAQS